MGIRILVLTPMIFDPPESVGGAERYASELSRALSARPEVDHVRVLAFGKRPRVEVVSPKLSVHVYRTWWVKGRRSNPVLPPACLVHRDWDVLYVHQFHTWLLAAAVAWAGARRKPLVLTDHNGGGATFNRTLELDRRIDLFLATSLLNVRETKLAAKRTAIIYGGVDLETFAPAEGAREGLLFVGRAHPVKGLEELLRHAAEAQVDGKLRLLLARVPGNEGYVDSLKALWRELGRRSRIDVSFEIDPPQPRVIEAYQSARWTLLPSLDAPPRESLGLTALESLACGTPAAVSRACGVAELAAKHASSALQVVDDWRGFIERALSKPAPPGARAWAEAHASWAAVAARAIPELVALIR